MKSYSSREVIKALKADGWYLHPTKDFAPGTIRGIERQSGLRFR